MRDSSTRKDAGLLVLRVWFGLVLALGHGWSKLGDFSSFVDSVARRGIPLAEASAAFAALSETLGGILMALGLFTRSAAACVVMTMMVAGLYVHWDDPFMEKEFALAYAIAALCVLLTGPGRFSIDGLVRRRSATKD